MAWQMDFSGVPRIHNFAAAEKFWAEAKPWRNELTTWRPLDGRRDRHKRIVCIDDGEGYQLVLYNTPLVTYYRTGDLALETLHALTMNVSMGCHLISPGSIVPRKV